MKMPFGKYKNQQIKDIPEEYLRWALETCTLRHDLEEEMENQLALKRGEGVSRKREK